MDEIKCVYYELNLELRTWKGDRVNEGCEKRAIVSMTIVLYWIKYVRYSSPIFYSFKCHLVRVVLLQDSFDVLCMRSKEKTFIYAFVVRVRMHVRVKQSMFHY